MPLGPLRRTCCKHAAKKTSRLKDTGRSKYHQPKTKNGKAK